MVAPLHILHLEDDPHDAALIQSTLEAGGLACATTRVETENDFVAALERGGLDLVISDFSLPKFDGVSALKIVRSRWPTLPLIIVSGTMGEERAIEALQNGAVDYVLKERLARLAPAVRRAITEVAGRAEHQRAEAERRETDERYRALFTTMDEGFCVVEILYDPAGRAWDYRFLEVNPSFAQQTGLVGAAGHTARELIPTIEDSLIQHYGEVARTGRPVRFTHRVEGLQRWFDIHAFRFGRPESHRVALLFSDITPRVLADQTLRESEQWLRAIFDQAAVGVVQIDVANGRFLRVNQRFCDIVGRTFEEIDRLTLMDISHPEDIDADLTHMTLLRDGSLSEFTREKRYVRKDGAIAFVSLAVSAIRSTSQTVSSSIAIVQDITERKRLDEHFLQAQKMEALGQFSGGVAHDFNNILAAISGYTELSRMTLQGNPAVHANLDAVLQATRRAADLVQQILTFSRQDPQVRQSIQLQTVVAECLKLMRVTIPATVEFDVSLDKKVPTVFANAGQVHQVLMNLGINAGHAMKGRAGRLQVTLEQFDVTAEYAATKPRLHPGKYVRLSVSDTGTGMDRVTLRRIFEPFFTTKAPGEGTGLGLSVVHGIMDSHDGAITVHSQPGEGTVFRLYFPVHAGASLPPGPDDSLPPLGRNEKILVVDDEESLAQMHRKALAALGYEAECVTNPVEALALVRANPARFSLVLTDQSMPRMTGLELATELRQIRPDLPVILMTGYSLSLTVERVEAARIRQLLLKPTSIHSLGTAVRAVLASNPPLPHGANPNHR